MGERERIQNSRLGSCPILRNPNPVLRRNEETSADFADFATLGVTEGWVCSHRTGRRRKQLTGRRESSAGERVEGPGLQAASLDLPQVVKAPHSPVHGVIHADQWPVAHELFGFLTAVVVECASQRDPHGCESGLKLDYGTDYRHQEGHQEG